MLFFHKPQSLIINGRIIFCNIRFIGQKLFLTGAVDLEKYFDYTQIKLYIENENINCQIISRIDYEPSLICIAENQKWLLINKLDLKIELHGKNFTYSIQKETYPLYNITAMTVFQYDYRLMDLYVDYYSGMGVECFYFYYNGEIDESKFDFMKYSNANIHIMEWNYPYWITRENGQVQHHAQMMAIMDSLYLMKEITQYCLYNDFDEYIFPNLRLTELIKLYPHINNFNFFCHWGSIGNRGLVSYSNAKEAMKRENILINKENVGFERRKSFIKVAEIKIMRIHFPTDFNQQHQQIQLSGFAHICNFEEYDRRSYLTFCGDQIGVNLNAGLGNRLFQIAFIYAYAKRNNKTEFGYYESFENPHSSTNYHQLVFPFIQRIELGQDFNIISEQQHECLSYVTKPNLPGPVLFTGYFQCEKYFKEYRKDLIQLFQFPPVPFQQKQPSMFIHVRRGDYVNNVNHDVNLFLYYHNALQEFKTKFGLSFRVYVISDDINYCMKYKLFQSYHSDVEYVQKLNELETVSLMKSCSLGGICSNSSFSWWGSYLNESNDKMVIFPSQWFANQFYQSFPKDIYFEGSYVMDIKTFEIIKV